MTAEKRSIDEGDTLAALCDVLALAVRLARKMPPDPAPTSSELLEALSASHICALRLAAERAALRRKPRRR